LDLGGELSTMRWKIRVTVKVLEKSQTEKFVEKHNLKGSPSFKWASTFLSNMQKSLAMLPTFSIVVSMAVENSSTHVGHAP